MRVGILTFHWATNYGAVLQCYALQQTLTRLGCEVQVIDYKPKKFEDTPVQFLKRKRYKYLREYLLQRRRERAIEAFRSKALNLSPKVDECAKIGPIASRYDVVIAGSDQVMNPSFLTRGEKRGVVVPSYFLGFDYDGRRVGYALSFGCTEYPERERKIAARYIGNFDSVSVRENTGVAIVSSMGRNDAVVMPDPTILLPSDYYRSLAEKWNNDSEVPYSYSFFIRNVAARRDALDGVIGGKTIWHEETEDHTMEGWLGRIMGAQRVVTDSFHCVVMCLKLHKPFVAVTDEAGNEGMNDRFYSLLGRLGLAGRILHKSELRSVEEVIDSPIDWNAVDNKLNDLAEEGLDFLRNNVVR